MQSGKRHLRSCIQGEEKRWVSWWPARPLASEPFASRPPSPRYILITSPIFPSSSLEACATAEGDMSLEIYVQKWKIDVKGSGLKLPALSGRWWSLVTCSKALTFGLPLWLCFALPVLLFLLKHPWHQFRSVLLLDSKALFYLVWLKAFVCDLVNAGCSRCMCKHLWRISR